jgi:hypothetical protein
MALHYPALAGRYLVKTYHSLSSKRVSTTNRTIASVICNVVRVVTNIILRTDNTELWRDVLSMPVIYSLSWNSLGQVSQIHLALTGRTSTTLFATHHDHWV